MSATSNNTMFGVIGSELLGFLNLLNRDKRWTDLHLSRFLKRPAFREGLYQYLETGGLSEPHQAMRVSERINMFAGVRFWGGQMWWEPTSEELAAIPDFPWTLESLEPVDTSREKDIVRA